MKRKLQNDWLTTLLTFQNTNNQFINQTENCIKS